MLLIFYFLVTLFLGACGIERENDKRESTRDRNKLDEANYVLAIRNLENCTIDGSEASNCTTATISARKSGVEETEIEKLLKGNLDRRDDQIATRDRYGQPTSTSSIDQCRVSITPSENCKTVSAANMPADSVDRRIQDLNRKSQNENGTDEHQRILIGDAAIAK